MINSNKHMTPMTETDAEIIQQLVEDLIKMNDRLGHQLLAVQSVCGWLLADRCMENVDPVHAVKQISAMFLGSADAIADNTGCGQFGHTSAGLTEVFERVGTVAEKTVKLRLAQHSN